YGDYRENTAPKAVLGLKFVILRDTSPDTEIVFEKQYEEEASLVENSPEGLMKGWERTLRHILIHFERDLREHNL
ncbi:MAG: hypothetical protein PVI20_17910, partial [Desulfobacteraceae bacterium]